MLLIVVAEIANNIFIFGVVEVIAVIGVVEEVVTPKRVDGLVFTFFKSGAKEETISETGCLRSERMFSLDKESTRSFTRLPSSNCNAST